MTPVVLDISRTVSRVGRGHATGIDRVELAYIEYFLDWPAQVGFLVRFRRRTTLFDREGMREFYELLKNDGPWDDVGIIRYLRSPRHHKSSEIEMTARRISLSWPFMARGLRKYMPNGFTYLNVGYGAMRPSSLAKLRQTNVGRIGFLIHDVIPLEYPEYCADFVNLRFSSEIHAVADVADFLIFNSTDTKHRTQHWLKKWEKSEIETHVALLGTDPLPYTSGPRPVEQPYFVILSTIEPRKNHRLLLDIWADFHANLPEKDIPHLYIVGGRGWLNEDIFYDLDHADFMGKTVHELGTIPDADLGPLLANAHALLFPSFAEGFGYPLVEAMQMNTPVICSDLAVFEEIAGDFPIFISPNNLPEWREQILATASQGRKHKKNTKKLPSWPEHFYKLDTILGNDS